MKNRFMVLRSFTSPEFGNSQYIEGMTYTIITGNEKLVKMAEKWLNDGLITFDFEDIQQIKGR